MGIPLGSPPGGWKDGEDGGMDFHVLIYLSLYSSYLLC